MMEFKWFVLGFFLLVVVFSVNDVVHNYIAEKQAYDYTHNDRRYGFHDIGNDKYYYGMNYIEYMNMLEVWENGGDVSTVDADWSKIYISKKVY